MTTSPPGWADLDWAELPGVHSRRPDPYIVWAQATAWADYPTVPWPTPDLHYRSVIVALNSASDLAAFCSVAVEPHFLVPRMYTPDAGGAVRDFDRYLTAFATVEGLALLADAAAPGPGRYVERFDLCEAIRPGRALDESMSTQPGDMPPAPPDLVGTQLLGIIDDGCPFAHSSFWHVVSGAGAGAPKVTTRFAAIWDQNCIDLSFSGTDIGFRPLWFPNGREMRRGDLRAAATATAIHGLDAWLDRHVDPDSMSVDEDACYGAAGCEPMRGRIVHGPHIAEIAAGPMTWRDTIAPTRSDPPEWGTGPVDADDAAADPAKTDIVFVQLPRGGLQDASGGWLDSHVLDGLRYLLACRNAQTTKTVVSLSYGATVGPHDGSSILANAMDALLASVRGPEEVDVVVAAGNGFDDRGHARLDLKAGESACLDWSVLPAGEAPSFLQIWMPKSSAATPWAVEVTVPGDPVAKVVTIGSAAVWPSASQPSAAVIYLATPSRGDGPAVLIGLAPTVLDDGDPRTPAPHGEWRITLRAGCAGCAGVAHAYIARNDVGIDALLRGRQSVFVDPADDPERELRAPFDDPGRSADDNGFFAPGSRDAAVVRRRATVNAIATGSTPIVVAGHQRNFSDEAADRTHAPYSSAGLIGDPRGRLPDTSYPTDESPTLRGVRSAGSRSGSTYRLIGTSTAAPQHVRWLLRTGPGQKPMPPACPDPEALGVDGGQPAGPST